LVFNTNVQTAGIDREGFAVFMDRAGVHNDGDSDEKKEMRLASIWNERTKGGAVMTVGLAIDIAFMKLLKRKNGVPLRGQKRGKWQHQFTEVFGL